jgi:2,3-bisphosphoglycerate-independent phosphoglycerate mutase
MSAIGPFRPVALIILDGFGLRDELRGNAVAAAHKPNFDRLRARFPFTTLGASGESVGLPDGQMGNSEVGHLNLGAGRVVYQELTRIGKSIQDGGFFANPALLGAAAHVKRQGTKLHIAGLLSDGGVHSHVDHLYALIELARREGVKDVCVHAITDGRDVLPTTGAGFARALQDRMRASGVGRIGTVAGRYYAMDRDKRWDRTAQAYNAMVRGQGAVARDPVQAIEDSYAQGVTDEFVKPVVIADGQGRPSGLIENGDAVVFFNFRPDRAVQLSLAFTDEKFGGFDRGQNPPQVYYVTMTRYTEAVRALVAYPPADLTQTFGEVVSAAGKRQLRIAETEKFPHVTYFFSGGREEPFAGEERVLIPSPKVATYDLQPEMSAPAVAEAAAERLASGELDAMILNFANPDMVGHTGVMEAAVKAVEAADAGLGRVMDAVLAQQGAAVILADHGNAETMIDPEAGGPCTTHTTNPVPCIVTVPGLALRTDGVLADVAPTLLALMGLAQPAEMTGRPLFG